MPKKRNSSQLQEDILCALQDLSVEDGANCSLRKGSVKKFKMKQVAKSASEDQRIVEDLVWNEHISEDEAQGDLQHTPILPGTKRKRKKSSVTEDDTSAYNEVHVDIWTLISTYIQPEDVGTFAAICKTTAFVVSRAGFWTSLYDRFCSHMCEMPPELRSWEIRHSDVVGLRSRVIRALFIAYEPLARIRLPALVRSNNLRRTHNPGYFSADKLVNAQCVVFWHKRCRASHHYVFKFFHRDRIPNQALYGTEFWRTSDKPRSPACMHPEDGCFLLEIVCSNQCKVDCSVIGLKLKLMYERPMEITRSLQTNKISLVFSPQSSFTSTPRRSDELVILLQPVVSVQVVPWWDQKYYSNIWPATGDASDDKDPDDPAW